MRRRAKCLMGHATIRIGSFWTERGDSTRQRPFEQVRELILAVVCNPMVLLATCYVYMQVWYQNLLVSDHVCSSSGFRNSPFGAQRRPDSVVSGQQRVPQITSIASIASIISTLSSPCLSSAPPLCETLALCRTLPQSPLGIKKHKADDKHQKDGTDRGSSPD